MVGRNDMCWCGSGKKWKNCHYPQKQNSVNMNSESLKNEYFTKHHILIKDDTQIEGIRKSCRLAAQILDATSLLAKEGVTTSELNEYAHKLHLEAGATPAPLHYGHPPFPKSICTSINEVICHGIPDLRPLKQGDILNIDVTCILNGYYGDCSRMALIGTVNEEKQRVVDVSMKA